MRTKSVPWGKITRGGTKERVGWDAPFPKPMPLPSGPMALLPSEKVHALFDERDAPPRGKMEEAEEADEGFERFFELWCPPRSAGTDRTALPGGHKRKKTPLLDQVVKLTGYVRKYVIQLLNQVLQHASRLLHPRQPIYGSVVQEALFLAWRTIQYPCAKRLVPFLPKLISVLEQDGHLRLGEEQRRQLLTMSVRTAERLLSTQRRPTPHGFSATKSGTLLKQQIPIRTFAQWDEAKPGFLEVDLVAHCGERLQGGCLYTMTLTDVATGWTECLPLLNCIASQKSSSAAALFPFP